MKISDNGLSKLKEWEGSRNTMYKDSAGLPTIGVGHLLTQDELTSGKIRLTEGPVRYSDGLSDSQILDLLELDLRRFENGVNFAVTVPLTQNQYDTLVSFAFNVGVNAFTHSTLLRKLNARGYHEVPRQLARWNRSGGVVVNGLKNRRAKETELWGAA